MTLTISGPAWPYCSLAAARSAAVLGSVQIAEDPMLFADDRDINQAQFLAGLLQSASRTLRSFRNEQHKRQKDHQLGIER